MPNITLPLEPTPPTQINPKLLVLYGQQKVGKTTLLSQLPSKNLPGKYVVLETDRDGGGADFVNCCRYPIRQYEDLTYFCAEVIKQGRPYTYGILDTASTFEDLCEVHATKEYKNSQQGKKFDGRSVLELLSGEFSPGYRFLRLSFQQAMAKMYDAFPYLIIICHLKDKYLKVESKDRGKSDSDVSAAEIDMAGKIRAMLVNAADATGFLYRTASSDGENQKMWVSFETDEVVNCGSRAQHLVQKKMEFDWSKIYI